MGEWKKVVNDNTYLLPRKTDIRKAEAGIGSQWQDDQGVLWTLKWGTDGLIWCNDHHGYRISAKVAE